MVPALGLPGRLEVSPLGVNAVPVPACLDEALEFDKPLEGDADGELDSPLGQGLDDLIAEEGAVHPDLQNRSGHGGVDGIEAGQDEGLGPVGVMDIARTMQEVEDRPRPEGTRATVQNKG